MAEDAFLQRFEERRAAREAADRTFQIAGATLTYRPSVAPEVGLKLDAMTVSDSEMLQVGDETVLACLTVESREEWAALRSPDGEHPLTFDEVFEIADYVLGRVAGIPTSAPADSSDGRTETAKPSKAKSSSRATAPTT